MLRQFGPSTWLAILLGSVLAVVAFLPVVAASYRRAGRLRLRDVLRLLAIAIYAVALWTYTLVPLPQGDDFTCVGANLHPFAFVDDIREAGGSLLRNPAFLQAAFNIVLFMPLGYFVRVVARRGVVVATGVGLVVTVAIEATQYTGIWGLFPCAYRVFDVDDIILNTFGALLGSVLAIPIAATLQRTRPAPAVDHVTLGRRLVGMLADLMVVTFLGIGTVIAWRAVALYAIGIPLDELPLTVQQLLGFAVPMALESWWVLRRSQTIGEAIVQLEGVARPGRELRSRVLKLLFGVGGYVILNSWSATVWAASVFALASVIVAWRTPGHRGISHLVAGMDLRLESPPPVKLDRDVF